VDPDGVHTFASQTHPRMACAGAVVTTVARAGSCPAATAWCACSVRAPREWPRPHARAPVPAALAALAAAGLSITDVDAVTTHNPFAVNDLVFARETGYPWSG